MNGPYGEGPQAMGQQSAQHRSVHGPVSPLLTQRLRSGRLTMTLMQFFMAGLSTFFVVLDAVMIEALTFTIWVGLVASALLLIANGITYAAYSAAIRGSGSKLLVAGLAVAVSVTGAIPCAIVLFKLLLSFLPLGATILSALALVQLWRLDPSRLKPHERALFGYAPTGG